MKRPLIIITLLLGIIGLSYATQFDDSTNDMTKALKSAAGSVSKGLAKNFGFYTGSGNAYAANTSGWFSLKAGAGLGVDLPGTLFNTNAMVSSETNSYASNLNILSQTLGRIPLPYDQFYFKLGLPELPMDAGFRIGLLPTMTFPQPDGGSFTISEFHFGLEARYLLWKAPLDLIKWDARASFDYEGGSIGYQNKQTQDLTANGLKVGTADNTTTFNSKWSGVSFGAKTIAGVNVPAIGSLYGGLGLNINLGGVTTEINYNNKTTTAGYPSSFSVSSGNVDVGYNLFDVRLIAGAQFLFINASVEYGPLDGSLAINFIPLSFAF